MGQVNRLVSICGVNTTHMTSFHVSCLSFIYFLILLYYKKTQLIYIDDKSNKNCVAPRPKNISCHNHSCQCRSTVRCSKMKAQSSLPTVCVMSLCVVSTFKLVRARANTPIVDIYFVVPQK